MPASVKLIVGLGNPGPKYSDTRHNAGFWFIDRLADKFQCAFRDESKFHGELARIQTPVIDCRLLKPSTYMNESGRSVQAVLDYFNISIKEMLVVYDEIDLEPGSVRFKQNGGHGGHNGVRDVIQLVGDKNFLRLRIGVGHPGSKDKVISYVLNRPSSSEQALIQDSIDKSLALMPEVFKGGLDKVMNELHQK